MDQTRRRFSRSIFVLDAFASISGLCVNYEKWNVVGLDLEALPQTYIHQENPTIKLANKKVYALGTWFSTVNDREHADQFFRQT